MTDNEELVITVDAPPDIPPGVYLATLTDMRGAEFTTPDGEDRKLLVWQFAAEVEGVQVEVEGVSSRATGPASKAYGWLVALLGAENVKPHASFRPKDLLGREVQVTIGPDKRGWPKVTDLTAMPRSKSKPPADFEKLDF